MATNDDEVASELLPLLRVYKSGRVERFLDSPIVPPSPQGDPNTGISSKDITNIKSPSISARLYLPTPTSTTQKLPILLYFRGGGFCIESAFSSFWMSYCSKKRRFGYLGASTSQRSSPLEIEVFSSRHACASFEAIIESYLGVCIDTGVSMSSAPPPPPRPPQEQQLQVRMDPTDPPEQQHHDGDDRDIHEQMDEETWVMRVS
ncbi:hypothetical protein Sjap_007868 [Stephania japonica]|uniref:Alpha/beta hydrolase fold-3 domain-containing protein n=1 Tax=Stephania japonica TaxID=461633 RepID=A0AAP0PBR1_9MAGN